MEAIIPVSSSWIKFYLQLFFAGVGMACVIASLLYDYIRQNKGEKDV
jgi:hypothetical protein